mmetsp:Transcript_27723/g.92134  ORF Transcript_27723/g.92134 Transcript_27723/m.92134 type:complete len:221 (-) Transcript_27723:92-754(-)
MRSRLQHAPTAATTTAAADSAAVLGAVVEDRKGNCPARRRTRLRSRTLAGFDAVGGSGVLAAESVADVAKDASGSDCGRAVTWRQVVREWHKPWLPDTCRCPGRKHLDAAQLGRPLAGRRLTKLSHESLSQAPMRNIQGCNPLLRRTCNPSLDAPVPVAPLLLYLPRGCPTKIIVPQSHQLLHLVQQPSQLNSTTHRANLPDDPNNSERERIWTLQGGLR